MDCNWANEINQSLTCFLHDPQPGPPWWDNPIGWGSLAIVMTIGAIMDWIKNRRSDK
jgi:hypothetical protein